MVNSKMKFPTPPIRKTKELAKIHNVKTSGDRQVKARRLSIVFGISLFCLCSVASPVQAEIADIIFEKGNIYTVSERQPHAEAIAVKGDRIVFAGSNSEA